MRLAGTQVERAAAQVVDMLATHDPATAVHVRRVAELCTAIATEMGLPAARVTRTRLAGLLHDTGKLETPLAVLTKPASLNDGERAVIMQLVSSRWRMSSRP